ncbi:hypothetical protein ABZT03_29970 [Streptomyces sp. NPDC005574]|uniref:hypothetical protein n=1 Tax=Streptomyces sp. NPDC005574 TaxID=3156891 RepID=UPI0033A97856
MLTDTAQGDSSLGFWPRVREFAVPASMIEAATARRRTGDWAGACAAAGVDVDLDPRAVARTHGCELTARLRADLRHLAPDLLRWHLPRIAPDGLLRPGLTLALARYDTGGPGGRGPLQLVVRTPPAWAAAGQRISLALRDATHPGAGARGHPHPHPSRRFRLDLHRHLWDARRTGELRTRTGADRPPDAEPIVETPELPATLPHGGEAALDRWADEAALVLRAEGRDTGRVLVRAGAVRLVLDVGLDPVSGPYALRVAPAAGGDTASALPVLPHAATWVCPDLRLIRAGAIPVERLHPLVASALAPECAPTGPPRLRDGAGQPRLVECRGAWHRVGLADGALAALDHDPAELRREELLVALTGTPLPCLRVIDEAHRHPDCLTGVRERLDHGDIAGALAVVEGLLGPGALLRGGALRDALEAAALGRIAHGLFRAGLADPGPHPVRPAPRDTRRRPAPSR